MSGYRLNCFAFLKKTAKVHTVEQEVAISSLGRIALVHCFVMGWRKNGVTWDKSHQRGFFVLIAESRATHTLGK